MQQTTPETTFRWTNESWGTALRSADLEPFADHCFTTRQLPLGLPGLADDEAWAAVASSVGVSLDRLRRVRQVHGATVVVHRKRGGPEMDGRPCGAGSDGRPAADALISDDPSIALAVQVADCAPILIADRRTGVVGAVHAGWRGTAARAVRSAVATLVAEFGVHPFDLVAAIGPCIGPCCYQVGPELPAAFEAAGHGRGDIARWFTEHDDEPRGLRLDLWRANRDQLLAEGLDPSSIHLAGLCTASREDLFFSFRRDGAAAGRMAAVIRAR